LVLLTLKGIKRPIIMKKTISILSSIILLSTLFFACTKEETTASSPKISFLLTDAPGDYDEVNVDVIGLSVHLSENDIDSSSIDPLGSGWIELPINNKIYNLIQLRDSSVVLVNSFKLPAGKISQVRLILGSNNTLKLKGDSILLPLETPSAMQSGLKINFHTTLKPGPTNNFILDFDADKSVVDSGGTYKLKPTIKVI